MLNAIHLGPLVGGSVTLHVAAAEKAWQFEEVDRSLASPIFIVHWGP